MILVCRFAVVFLFLVSGAYAYGATLHVSPNGNDAHDGTIAAPLRTITAAAKRAMPGDVVLVAAGVYRERVTPHRGGEPGKPIVYRGEPGKRVFIKGSEIWKPDWRDEGDGVYSARPDDELFDDRSAEYLDHHNPLKVLLASTPWHRQGRRETERRESGDQRVPRGDNRIVYTCGQVFVDGQECLEVPLREELKEMSWWYEPASERVYVHFGDQGPTDHEVELTVRRRLFAPAERGLGHIVVEGFIFEHCGNQYPTNFWDTDENAQKGAVGTEAGHHWVIRRNIVRRVKTFAIDAGAVDRHTKRAIVSDNLIEENYLIDNGSGGILSNASVNMVIRGNVILRNNHLHFYGIKRWEQAGIKTHQFKDGLIEQNYVAHNYDMSGIWLDNQFPDSRVSRNFIYANDARGLFLEMSDYEFDRLLIDNNVILGNKENAAYSHDASGATFVNNLLANTGSRRDQGHGIHVLQVGPRTKTYHHTYYNNLLIGNPRNVEVNYPAARSGPQRFDHNLYSVQPDARAFVINNKSDKPSPWTAEEFKALVLKDLGLAEAPAVMTEREGQAAMTIDQWRAFWKHHGEANDQHSSLAPDASVTYDEPSLTLTIDLACDAAKVGCKDHPAAKHDYFGNPRTEGRCAPGPFADLPQGGGRLVVWDGLPLVGENELPAADWTRGL